MERAAPYARELLNMGGLTIISNIYGNPAVSIPSGTVDGLPVGMQVLARHHEDALLFDVALCGRARAALADGGAADRNAHEDRGERAGALTWPRTTSRTAASARRRAGSW